MGHASSPDATEGAAHAAYQWSPEPEVRARILSVAKALRQRGAAVSTEALIAADAAERKEYHDNWDRYSDKEWTQPDLAKAQREIDFILPTLIELTGFLLVAADIDAWVRISDIVGTPPADYDGRCCYAGDDAGRTVWMAHACGKPSAFVGLQQPVLNYPSDPVRRARVSWVTVCEEDAPAASVEEQVIAYGQTDGAKEIEARLERRSLEASK